MAEIAPHLRRASTDRAGADWGRSARPGAMDAAPFAYRRSRNFYMTDPISRASHHGRVHGEFVCTGRCSGRGTGTHG
jgi:hypothetical protein